MQYSGVRARTGFLRIAQQKQNNYDIALFQTKFALIIIHTVKCKKNLQKWFNKQSLIISPKNSLKNSFYVFGKSEIGKI